ncbi:MAG: TatD family hydrolase [Ginsengibacter sp.]
MTFIDTHTHLYLKDFEKDIEEVIKKANEVGVEKFYLPAIDSSETNALLSLEQAFPGKCFAMAGLHPCSVKADYRTELEIINKQLTERSFAAIGETGLDFYWDRTFIKQQYDALQQQIDWALHFDLPIVLHTRNATQETIDVIANNKSNALRGIFHCFSGTIDQAQQIASCGFFLGIGGVVTYKNSGLAEVISNVSLEHIVLETDSPYLTPVPFRGKRNESSYLRLIAEKIAVLKNISVEEVAEITTKNAMSVFGN